MLKTTTCKAEDFAVDKIRCTTYREYVTKTPHLLVKTRIFTTFCVKTSQNVAQGARCLVCTEVAFR